MSGPRILVVIQAGDAYPAGTIRALNYREHFRRAGADVTFANVFPPSLTRLGNTPPKLLAPLAPPFVLRALALSKWPAGFVNMLHVLRIAGDYDAIYLSTIWSEWFVRQLRKATKARLVYDFGDALWEKGSSIRGDFPTILRTVDAVTTDNEYTAAYARRFQPNTTVIPDPPPLELYDRFRDQVRPEPGTVTVGWLGSSSTTFGLYAIWEALERVCRAHDHVRLRLVGPGPDYRLLPPFGSAVRYSIVSNYTQDEMVREVLGMDIGLFPLHDVEVSQARGVLKACNYMAGEAAIVASPVGRTLELIEDGVNGVLARTTDEWVAQLERLIRDAELRSQLTRAGLETIRSSFTAAHSFTKLYPILVSRGG